MTEHHYSKTLERSRKIQHEASKITAEYKGKLQTLRDIYKNDRLIQAYTDISDFAIKEFEARQLDVLAVLELILPIISQQEKQISRLSSIVRALVSKNKHLSAKLSDVDKWTKRREEMLSEIESFVDERKHFLNENK
jgi:hypothetical protein